MPKCGGLFKQDDDKVMAFARTDPDACVCTTYASFKLDSLTGKDGGAPPFPLIGYKGIIFTHLIKNSMWDVFNYVELKRKSTINLLNNLGQFTLTEIQGYTTIKPTTADQHAIQKLDWSGQYFLNSINISIYSDVFKKVTIDVLD
eukprot:3713524-Ditylum_brightwellii.AAC.2